MKVTRKNQELEQQCTIKQGESILTTLRNAGIELSADCAGAGTCGKCRVQIVGTKTVPDAAECKVFTNEELENDYRLACRREAEEGMIIVLPQLRIGGDRKKKMVKLPEGFLQSVLESGEKKNGFGVAFDIGTTTVVGMLWNLETGELLDAESMTNPQRMHGADVISRILYTIQEEEGLIELQNLIITCLNDLFERLIKNHSLLTETVREIVIVGNTTMTHLLLGVDPQSLAKAPFSPGYTGPATVPAASFGESLAPDTSISVLANIAGHVGADLTAVLLATSLDQKKGNYLAVDIGTNGEILASKDGRVLACSTAAGPAFEGASISIGMRAEAGAIERVQLENGDVVLSVIDSVDPIGICGSGLIDCAAALIRAGIVNSAGKMLSYEDAVKSGIPKKLCDRLVKTEKGNTFVLYSEKDGAFSIDKSAAKSIAITQRDLREIQLAKGAISAGMTILLQELGISANELDAVYLAGAFGNYIDRHSALTIGLLPNIDAERIVAIGNAAGTGASMALLSESERIKSERLVQEVEHIELSEHPAFQSVFLNSMNF